MSEYSKLPTGDVVSRTGTPAKQMSRTNMVLWDERIKADLQTVSAKHATWKQLSELTRNTGAGKRRGNLVESFVRTLWNRLFAAPWTYRVQPYDPDYREKADEASIVAQAVAEITHTRAVMRKCVRDSLYATTGWMEVCHPLDPYSLDLERSAVAPNTSPRDRFDLGTGQDRYEVVDQTDLAAAGIDPTSIPTLDPFTPFPTVGSPEVEPQPAVSAEAGYPYLLRVDPRLVWVPPTAEDWDGVDYVARLHFLTRAQLSLLGYNLPSNCSELSPTLRAIYDATYPTKLAYLPDGVVPLVQVFIRSDVRNPEHNHWMLVYPLGYPEHALWNRRSPYGAMVKFVPVRVFDHKSFYDEPAAAELREFANWYDLALAGIGRRIRRARSLKTFVGPNAGVSPTASGQIEDDDYSGPIKVGDPNQIKSLMEANFDPGTLALANFVRSLAGSAVGASPMDQGQPTKDITARQTVGLQEAQSVLINSAKEPLAAAGVEAIYKMMYMLGLYSHQGAGRKYSFGARMVKVEPGSQDYTTSFVYNVTLTDNDPENTERQMVLNQVVQMLLRDGQGMIVSRTNLDELIEEWYRALGFGRAVLARYAPPPPAPPAVPPVNAGGTGLFDNLGVEGGAGDTGVVSLPGEEHPERLAGSRGVGTGMQNALQAMRSPT